MLEKNYATRKELDHAKGLDTSDLPAKKDFIALKAEIDIVINKMVSVATILNNWETKADDLDVGKLKTIPITWKKSVI